MLDKILEHVPVEVKMPVAVSKPVVQLCKVIPTTDPSGKSNGKVVEVAKNEMSLQENIGIDNKNEETTVYISTVSPGTMKGYHGHTLRTSHYTMIQGKGEIQMLNINTHTLEIYSINSEEAFYRTITPPGYYVALKNTGDKEVVLVGVPNPPYNHKVKEQVELDPQKVTDAINKGLIIVERYICSKDGIRKENNSS